MSARSRLSSQATHGITEMISSRVASQLGSFLILLLKLFFFFTGNILMSKFYVGHWRAQEGGNVPFLSQFQQFPQCVASDAFTIASDFFIEDLQRNLANFDEIKKMQSLHLKKGHSWIPKYVSQLMLPIQKNDNTLQNCVRFVSF